MVENKLIDTVALGTTVRRVREDYIEKIAEAKGNTEAEIVTEDELKDMLDEIFGTTEADESTEKTEADEKGEESEA